MREPRLRSGLSFGLTPYSQFGEAIRTDVFTIRVIETPDQIQGLLFGRVDFPNVFPGDGDAVTHVGLPRSTGGSRSVVYAIMINEALVPDGLQSSFDARRTSYRQQRADAMLEKGSLDGQRVWFLLRDSAV